MGCLYIIALFFFIGAFYPSPVDLNTKISSVLMGIFLIAMARFFSSNHKHYKIDSHVENKIIATDGNGRYLVEAKTSRQIIGPRPHVMGNLPANLYRIKKGLWIVDSTHVEVDADKIKWKNVDGNFSINPRGNTQTGGFLSDTMEGWEHNYIQRDD